MKYSLEEIETAFKEALKELELLFVFRSDRSVLNIFYEFFVKKLKGDEEN